MLHRNVLLAGLMLLALTGCHHRRATLPAATATVPGIVVSQARLVLPAVAGHPAATYFTVANEAHSPATLVGVDIGGVRKTEMHQTSQGTMQELSDVRIDPGKSVIFAPGGKHVMAFDLSPGLTRGGIQEITLRFADARTVVAPLRIETMAGEAADSMPGMVMGKP